MDMDMDMTLGGFGSTAGGAAAAAAGHSPRPRDVPYRQGNCSPLNSRGGLRPNPGFYPSRSPPGMHRAPHPDGRENEYGRAQWEEDTDFDQLTADEWSDEEYDEDYPGLQATLQAEKVHKEIDRCQSAIAKQNMTLESLYCDLAPEHP